MKTKFKKGDKVELKNDSLIDRNEQLKNGYKGIIIVVQSDYGVKWENFTAGHDLNGKLEGYESRSGWFVIGKCLKLISNKVTNWREEFKK